MRNHARVIVHSAQDVHTAYVNNSLPHAFSPREDQAYDYIYDDTRRITVQIETIQHCARLMHLL